MSISVADGLDRKIQKESEEKMPHDLTLEELVDERIKLDYYLQEVQSAISIYNQEILDRLNEDKLNGTVVNDKAISKVKRFSFSQVSFEKAKELGATKLVTDNSALKKIFMKSPKLLPEVTFTEYLMIRDVTQKEDSE